VLYPDVQRSCPSNIGPKAEVEGGKDKVIVIAQEKEEHQGHQQSAEKGIRSIVSALDKIVNNGEKCRS